MSGAFELIANALGGGLIGSIASGVARWHDAKMEVEKLRLEHSHEAVMADKEAELAKIQIANQVTLAEIDARQTVEVEQLRALQESYDADRATYSAIDATKANKWLIMVDVVRGLVRPALTGFLTVCSIFLAVYLMVEMHGTFKSNEGYALLKTLIENLVGCMGLSIAWWFGSRNPRGGN